MLFGEIVEPSTRALIDDVDDITNLEKTEIKWNETPIIPDKIQSLLITETDFVEKLVKTCLIPTNMKPLYESEHKNITIYSIESNKFVIHCRITDKASCGKITEYILNWIPNAQSIYAVTTAPSAVNQTPTMTVRPPSFLRTLETGISLKLVPYLETPNIVTGAGANILSYCKHVSTKCALFIGYIEHGPLDSENSKPFLKLFEQIGFTPIKACALKDLLPENNLYT